MKIIALGALAAITAFAAPASLSALAAADPVSVPAPTLNPGDTWVYDQALQRGTNGFSQSRLDLKIERVGADTMVVGIKPDSAPIQFEDHIAGTDWSIRRIVDGQETVTGQPFSFPLVVGKTWTSDFADSRPLGLQLSGRYHTVYKVVGWEDVVTPAGTYRALKIEANGTIEAQMAAAAAAAGGGVVTSSGGTATSRVARSPAHTAHGLEYKEFYYVPAVKYYVKSVEEVYNGDNVLTHRDTRTLVSFKPGT